MNENNRGTLLWLTIGIAVCVSLLSIAAYDYLNKRYARQEAREIVERHEQEKDTAAAAAVHKDRLRHAINAGSVLKTYIAEYHANTGETPADLDALGLPPDWLPSDLLQEVEVRPGGLVVMHFTPESGLQGEVRLQMRVDSAAYKWDCSGNIPDIAEASDGCRYVP